MRMNDTKPSNSDSVVAKKWLKMLDLSHQKALIMAAIVLAGGGLAVGYRVGHQQGLTKVGYDADAQDLAEIVEKQKQTLNSISLLLNTTTQERDLAVDNAKQLNQELVESKQAQNLAQSLSLTYRKTLQQRGGLSLGVQNLAIKPLPSDAYEYVLDLMQVSSNNTRSSGRIELRLIQGEEIVVIPMEKANFNFDYHQRLTGRWTMPKGFVPQYVEVRLMANKGAPVLQRFIWQRGKQEIESPAFITDIPQTQAHTE
jgi:hypothetical protein